MGAESPSIQRRPSRLFKAFRNNFNLPPPTFGQGQINNGRPTPPRPEIGRDLQDQEIGRPTPFSCSTQRPNPAATARPAVTPSRDSLPRETNLRTPGCRDLPSRSKVTEANFTQPQRGNRRGGEGREPQGEPAAFPPPHPLFQLPLVNESAHQPNRPRFLSPRF